MLFIGAATADQNATLHFALATKEDREVRVVIVKVISHIAEVNNLVALRPQQLGQLFLHFEAAVIGAHSHDVLPLAARFVQRDLVLCRRYDVVYAEAELLQ